MVCEWKQLPARIVGHRIKGCGMGTIALAVSGIAVAHVTAHSRPTPKRRGMVQQYTTRHFASIWKG